MAACGACPCSMTTASPAGACAPSGGPTRRPPPASRAAPEGRAAGEEVRHRHLAGETLAAIGRATGLAHGAVRKHAHGLELSRTRGPWPRPEPARPLHHPSRAPHGRGLRGRHGAVRARCGTSAMAARPVRCSASWPSGARRRRPARRARGSAEAPPGRGWTQRPRGPPPRRSASDARAARGGLAGARGRCGRPRPAGRRGGADSLSRAPVHRARAPRLASSRTSGIPTPAARSTPGSRMPGRAAPR